MLEAFGQVELNTRAERAMLSLARHIQENPQGHDPMDALASPLLRSLPKNLRIASTQFFRYSPVNLRGVLGIPEDLGPKAAGLLLSASCRMGESGQDIMAISRESLCQKEWHSRHWSWGYTYPWQDRHSLLPPCTPNIVATAYAGHGLMDHYTLTGERESLTMAESACRFILELPRTDGVCFSYTPVSRDIVLNASALGASLLARVGNTLEEKEFLEEASAAVEFIVSKQNKDGSWPYSLDPETGEPRTQNDWHQGFILDSLDWCSSALGSNLEDAIKYGAEFYKTLFTSDGRGYMRHPRLWPIDLHNQAQGIVTFSRLREKVDGASEQADKILGWTLDNMLAKDGSFYYQRHKRIVNKIPYTRWQAWMLYALGWYLEAKE